MGWHDGRQAMDFTVNAASGYPLMTGPDEWDQETAPPVNQVLPAWDFITGAYCAFALLAALHHRDATGEGSEVRVPLGDVAIGTVANSGAMAEMLYRGGDRPRLGNAIWGALGRDFVSRDGKRFMVAVLTAQPVERDGRGARDCRCRSPRSRPRPGSNSPRPTITASSTARRCSPSCRRRRTRSTMPISPSG